MDNDLQYPVYSDEWMYKSDAERRRWALEAVGIRSGTGRPVSDYIDDADAVLAYINGPSVSVPDPSSASPDPIQTADMPAQQLLATT